MQGRWKEEVSGWDGKGSRRKKASRKHTLRDKRVHILKDFWQPEKHSKNITRIENAQTITWVGSRWGVYAPLPKYADVFRIGFRIPDNSDPYNDRKGSYVRIRAYKKGASYYNDNWYEADTGKSIREYFDLSLMQAINISPNRDVVIIEKHGKKLLDWSEEIKKRSEVHTKDFSHITNREFVYGKPFEKWFKWNMYQESGRRKWAHKYTTGATRASVRNWIMNGDWDAERKIPPYEKTYAWLVD